MDYATLGVKTRLVAAALVALGLLVGLVANGTTPAAGAPTAIDAAKKKCKKKKGKKSAVAAKKCKKKKKAPVTPVTPAPPPGPPAPIVRASATWIKDTVSTDPDPDEQFDAEVDMHVFDSSGNHTYYSEDGIPETELDDSGSGNEPELFTDLAPEQNRSFGVYVCLYDYNDPEDEADEVDVDVEVTLRDTNGATRTVDLTLNGEDDEAFAGATPLGSVADTQNPTLGADFCDDAVPIR